MVEGQKHTSKQASNITASRQCFDAHRRSHTLMPISRHDKQLCSGHGLVRPAHQVLSRAAQRW